MRLQSRLDDGHCKDANSSYWVVTGSIDGTVRAYSISDMVPEKNEGRDGIIYAHRQFVPEEGVVKAVNAVCISDNNNFVLSGGDDMVVSAFDFRDGRGRGNRIKRFGRRRTRLQQSDQERSTHHRSAVRSICMIGTCKPEDALQGKGYMVITGTVDGMIRIFDFETEDFIFTANTDTNPACHNKIVPMYRSFGENLEEKKGKLHTS